MAKFSIILSHENPICSFPKWEFCFIFSIKAVRCSSILQQQLFFQSKQRKTCTGRGYLQFIWWEPICRKFSWSPYPFLVKTEDVVINILKCNVHSSVPLLTFGALNSWASDYYSSLLDLGIIDPIQLSDTWTW